MKHPGKLNVWGCFGSAGFGELEIFPENMTGEKYKAILESHLLSSAAAAVPRRWRFQDDNDPKHRSRLVRNWLEENNINRMDWPSNSPDLNPIENVWALLKKRVGQRAPKTLDQLQQHIKEEWEQLPRTLAAKLVASMPGRLDSVITRGGDSIDY